MNTGGDNHFKLPPEIIYNLWDEGKSIGEISKILENEISKSTIRKYLASYPKYSKEESKRREGFLKRKTDIRFDNINDEVIK